MAVSKRTRFEVFKRDAFQCQYCGRTPPVVVLECDHVTPVAGGGGDEETNLITSCFDCNRGKSDVPLQQVVPGVAERMERERDIAEQVEAYNALLMEKRIRIDGDMDDIGRHWFNKFKKKQNKYVFGDGRVPSIRTFLKRLPKVHILDAVDIAHARKPVFGDRDDTTFKYFCGICWKMIKDGDA